MTRKRWMGWTAGATLAVALTAWTTSTGFACDQHAQGDAAKDAKAASGEAKGCDMPCCAKKAAASAKNAAPAAPAVAAQEGGKACDKPCDAGKTADGKTCPKKSAAVAKVGPAQDAPEAEAAANAGARR